MINDEWEQEKDRQSRIDAQLAVMPPHQLKRLEAEQREMELALARVFGVRLRESIAQRIIAGMVIDPSCLCTVGGGVRELPSNRSGWDAYAKQQAEQEPLAMLCIEAADADLRERIRNEARASLPAVRRMAMARKGELDDYLDGVVAEKLQERAGV